MSGLFVNKVMGALLASGLGFIMINKFSNVVMKPDVPKPENFAYSLAIEAPKQQVEAVDIPFPSPTWLEARNAEKGAKVFKKCKSCHTIDAGGKDGTGPHLWNILGRPIGGVTGFSYSDGMKTKGGVWGYEELDAFLTKPKNYITKTKMSFNGLKKETDRAAVIEYMRLAADAPIAQLTAMVKMPDMVQDETAQGEMVQDEMAPTTTDDLTEKMAGEVIDKVEETVKEE